MSCAELNKEFEARPFNWLDVKAMLSEIKPLLINSKVDKVYEISQNILQIRFHNPVHKKLNLIVDLPNYFFITKKEFEKPTKPSAFVMLLRKKLQNSRLTNIEQVASERLLKLYFSKDENFVLYLELIKPGNVVLCNEQDVIIRPYRILEFSSRRIAPHEKYVFPLKKNLFDLNKDNIIEILKTSNKQSIVKALALDINLGGFYSELILSKLNLEKDKAPSQLKEQEIESIADFVLTLIKNSQKEQGKECCLNNLSYLPKLHESFVFDNRDCLKVFKSFSSVMEFIFENSHKEQTIIEQKSSSKSEKLKRIITSQRKELEEVNKQYEYFKEQGELIYQNYAILDEILKKIKSLREKKISYEEIESILKEQGYNVKIDAKNNKLVVDL